MVIIDTLARFHGGQESNEHLSVFVKAMERIREHTGWSVLASHHISQQAQLNDANLDMMAVRGGTALVSNTRFHLAMQTMTEQEAKLYGVDQDERWRYVQLASGGFNYGAPLGNAWFERHEGGVLFQTDLKPIPQGKAEQPDLHENIVNFIVGEIGGGHYHSKRRFCERFGGADGRFSIGQRQLRDAIDLLIDEGRLTQMNLPQRLKGAPNYRSTTTVLATAQHAEDVKAAEANAEKQTAEDTADPTDLGQDSEGPT